MAYLRLRKIFSRIPEGHWYIANFAIHPQFQGKGKGTQLLSEVIAEVKKHKAEHITLDTASDNVRALRLYEHAGFKTVHVFASNYAGLAPRSRMTLALRYPQQFLD